MREENLKDIDLNLLVMLRALLETQSVSRAALQLGLSQPAMSHALNRLRNTFEDQILVRAGRRMVPTPRAEQMLARLQSLLDEAEHLILFRGEFDPAHSRRAFSLVTNGFASFAVFPKMQQALRAQAPNVDLRVRQLGRDDVRELLADGGVDIGLVTGELSNLPESLFSRRLFDDPFVCVVRTDHPLVGDTVSIDTYCELQHILVSPRGDSTGVVDRELAERGMSRRVSLVLPDFLAVPEILISSDYIVTVPASIAKLFANRPDLKLVEPPCDLPVGSLIMLWHERVREDPAHQWLRTITAEAADLSAYRPPGAGA